MQHIAMTTDDIIKTVSMQLTFYSYTWSLTYVPYFHQGWSGGAKVSCILRHQGVQLILA